MSTVAKFKCFLSLLIITVAASLLPVCYFCMTSTVGVPKYEKSSVENLSDNELCKRNLVCISRKLRNYKLNIINTSVPYLHPNIVHYVMLSATPRYQLIFRDYMSMLSVYKFLKPEKIILHTNTDVVGAYWMSIQEWSDIVVEIHKIERVPKLAGVKVKYISHEADYMKLRILKEYGGSIFDFDVIMINGTRWRKQQKISACILSVENNNDRVNLGAISCIKGSSFVGAWLYKYHTDYRKGWLYNCGTVPSDILRKSDSNGTCYNVYVDETISQDPDYNKVRRWVDGNYYVNWKKKTAAHYFYHDLSFFGQLKLDVKNELMLVQNSSLGELLRHVSND